MADGATPVYGMSLEQALIHVWYDGFNSGGLRRAAISSCLAEAADAKADELVAAASESPELRAQVQVEVRERITSLMQAVMAKGPPLPGVSAEDIRRQSTDAPGRVGPAADNHAQPEGVDMANETLVERPAADDEFFPDDALPIHHLDEDRDGQERGVCPHSGGSRTDGGGCPPRGCEGATEHYSNDGHRRCYDPAPRSARGLERNDEYGYRPRRHLGL